MTVKMRSGDHQQREERERKERRRREEKEREGEERAKCTHPNATRQLRLK